jgi:hypothetical protein
MMSSQSIFLRSVAIASEILIAFKKRLKASALKFATNISAPIVKVYSIGCFTGPSTRHLSTLMEVCCVDAHIAYINFINGVASFTIGYSCIHQVARNCKSSPRPGAERIIGLIEMTRVGTGIFFSCADTLVNSTVRLSNAISLVVFCFIVFNL